MYLELKEPTGNTIAVVGNMIRSCGMSDRTVGISRRYEGRRGSIPSSAG